MVKTHDVIIVGAGPAGSALGILLARAGMKTLLLEKYEFPRDKVCGDFVSPRGLKKLAELGCGDEIARREYVPVTKSLVFLENDWLSEGLFPHLPEHPPFGHAIPRAELDEIIFRQAQRDGAETVENCEVTNISVSEIGVRVDAMVVGTEQHFCGRLVVGADGANSIVARYANLEMRDQRYVQLAMRAYCKGFPYKHTVLYFEEEFFPGFGWVFPVRDGIANVGVGMVKEPMKKDGIHLRAFYSRFVSFVHRLAEKSGAKIELTRSNGWPRRPCRDRRPADRSGARRTSRASSRALLAPWHGVALAVIVGAASPASAQLMKVEVGTDLVLESDAVHPGGTIRGALEVRIPGKYHVQSNAPLDEFLIPTRLTVMPPQGFTVSAIVYPKAVMLESEASEGPMAVFEQTFVIGFTIDVGPEVAPGSYALASTLQYQACDDKYCLAPTSVELGGALEVVPKTVPIVKVESLLFNGLDFGGDAAPVVTPPAGRDAGTPDADCDIMDELSTFTILGTTGGYLGEDDFLAFMDAAETGTPAIPKSNVIWNGVFPAGTV